MPDAPVLDELLVARAMDELGVTRLQVGAVSVYVPELERRSEGTPICHRKHHDIQCERAAGHDGPCAADDGNLYRTAADTYRIPGRRTPVATAYVLAEAGLIEGAGEWVTHYGAGLRGTHGETIQLTTAGHEALKNLGIHTREIGQSGDSA